VVVSAAGNLGRGPDGKPQYGAIAAPGNAPWVITVGASNHNGTVDRSDDTVAAFSSRGPTAFDLQAKPDLVAPGVLIESIAEAGSTLFNTKPLMRLWGTVPTANEPYLSLSGTSMASPVVSGTIALMLQANPALTPNLVKAILQFTAETRDGYNPLTQGAGFLNARGAVELAQSLTTAALAAASTGPATIEPDPTPWSRQVIWGNHRIAGGQLSPAANAWRTDVIWGSGQAPDGNPIVLGTISVGEGGPAATDNIVWSTACGDSACDDVVWGTARESGGIVWRVSSNEPIVWGTNVLDETDNVMWGASAIRSRSRMLVTEAALR
jgi:subtilisin family serine protease